MSQSLSPLAGLLVLVLKQIFIGSHHGVGSQAVSMRCLWGQGLMFALSLLIASGGSSTETEGARAPLNAALHPHPSGLID